MGAEGGLREGDGEGGVGGEVEFRIAFTPVSEREGVSGLLVRGEGGSTLLLRCLLARWCWRGRFFVCPLRWEGVIKNGYECMAFSRAMKIRGNCNCTCQSSE